MQQILTEKPLSKVQICIILFYGLLLFAVCLMMIFFFFFFSSFTVNQEEFIAIMTGDI